MSEPEGTILRPEDPGKSLIRGITQRIEEDAEMSMNIRQQLIVTTEDKIALCIHEHMRFVEKRKEWLTPFSIFLTAIIVLITADFKDWVLPKATWQAFFLMLAFISFAWLVVSLVQMPKHINADTLVEKIKKGNIGTPIEKPDAQKR